MPITICSLNDALRIHQNFDYVISITDPSQTMPDFGTNHLRVRFEDTDAPNEEEYSQMRRGVMKIISWVKSKELSDKDNILIHCMAGVSRSAAIAWTLKIMFGEGIMEAFDALYKQRDCIWPNIQVANFADQILGLQNAFVQAAMVVDQQINEGRFAKWKTPTAALPWKRS